MTPITSDADHAISQFSMDSHALVEGAKLSLKSISEQRLGVAEKVARVVQDIAADKAVLQRRLVEAERRIAETERRNAELAAENVALLKSRQSMSESHRRLYACFINLLKSVDEHAAGAVSVEQRIEATIQASDFAVETGESLDVVSTRMANFLDSFGREPAVTRNQNSNSY